jgi:CDP-glycerol glycerophosphotransferase
MPELVPGLVSVIVPIYNVEPFLADCLDSLRGQTYRDLQVILVDDGSTDGCVGIAQEFVAADERFTLIRQANAGLSAARNTGIPHATGEYLAFVDSDDVLAAHAYETLVQALAGGADFASGGVHRYSSRGHYNGYPHNDAIRSTDLAAHVSGNAKLLRDRTIWNKLFRRTFWDRHGFEFPAGRLFEDVPVTVPAHARAEKVAVVKETIYFWRVREGAVRSITQSDNDLRNLVDRFHSVNLTRRSLTESGHHDLRRVYEEQAIWDKLSSYLKYLPAASPEFRETFMELATAYLADIDPGAVERQPVRVRRQWELIRERKVDELFELIDEEFRPAVKPPAPPRLESALQDVAWHDGKLVLTGYAYVPGGVPRRWGSLRLLWLSADGNARKVPLRARSHRDPDAPPAVRAGGFTVAIDPAALSSRHDWRNGTWTVAVAATQGVKVRRDGLKVPEDWTAPMPRRGVAPGVWVSPVITKGRLRIKVTRSAGWLTGSRRDGDDLVLEGRLRSRPKGPVTVQLNRAKGIIVRTVRAQVTDGPDGPAFTARVALAGIGLDDSTDNHAAGLFAQRLAVDIVIGDKPAHLLADDDYVQTRTVWGTDEVYTTIAGNGFVWICTRPAGPVVTEAVWRPDGALVLRGDTPHPLDGRLVLRMRGRRRDVSFPLHTTGDHWEVVADPSAAPSLAGPLPLIAGTWDFAFRTAGNRHETICPLGLTDAARAGLPTSAVAPDGTRSVLRQAGNERATVTVEAEKPDPAVQEGLHARYFPAAGRAALRDVVLFDGASGRRFIDDPAAVLAELIRRADAPPARWTVERGQPVPAGADPVRRETEQWYEALATSRWIVTNDDLPRWLTPQPGQVLLRLAGGWPIARFGAQAVAHPLGQELVDQIASDAAVWTALASPGASATPVLRRELRFGGTVLEYGRPADDLLTARDAHVARAEVLRRLDLPPDTRLVLYAPTRRPMDLRKRGWSDPGRLLDLPRVVASLPSGYELLARRHPGLVDDVMGLAPGVRDVSGYPNVAELLLATDVLITDYSSLLADFAITGRPTLLFVPDLAEFGASPGLNVDLETASPGPLLRSSEEVAAAVRNLPAVGAEYERAAKAFAETHQAGGEGQAAVRLVDWLLAAGRRPAGAAAYTSDPVRS